MQLFKRGQRRRNQLTHAMGDLATAFVARFGTGEGPLEFTVPSLRTLDAMVDRFLAGEPSPPVRDAMARGMAAFFGEVIVREDLATWALEPGTEHPLLAMAPDGVPVVNVLAVVRRRFVHGPPDALATLLDSCVEGFTRPEGSTPEASGT